MKALSVKVPADVASALANAEQMLSGPAGKAQLETALEVLETRHRDSPNPYLAEMIFRVRAQLSTPPTASSVAALRSCFSGLVEPAETGQTHLSPTRAEDVHVEPHHETAMSVAIALGEASLAGGNAPVGVALTINEKFLAVGANRSYTPVRRPRAHAEPEALDALEQRTFAGMAAVLLAARDAGYEIDETTSVCLDGLLASGLDRHGVVRETAGALEAQGFFDQGKLLYYANQLNAFVAGNYFARKSDGQLDDHYDRLLDDALANAGLDDSARADWASYDDLLTRQPGARMDVFCSLEPCPRCMFELVSQGGTGRLWFAAQDGQGGGAAALNGAADMFVSQGRLPFQIIGGLLGDKAQPVYDRFETEIYPTVSGRGGA